MRQRQNASRDQERNNSIPFGEIREVPKSYEAIGVRDVGLSLKNKVSKTNLFYMIGKGWGHQEITKLFSQTACYRRTSRPVADGKWTKKSVIPRVFLSAGD